MTKEQARQRKNEYQKRYYRANRERLLAYAAAYRRDNPERTLNSVKACQERIKRLREQVAREERRLEAARKHKTAIRRQTYKEHKCASKQ